MILTGSENVNYSRRLGIVCDALCQCICISFTLFNTCVVTTFKSEFTFYCKDLYSWFQLPFLISRYILTHKKSAVDKIEWQIRKVVKERPESEVTYQYLWTFQRVAQYGIQSKLISLQQQWLSINKVFQGLLTAWKELLLAVINKTYLAINGQEYLQWNLHCCYDLKSMGTMVQILFA